MCAARNYIIVGDNMINPILLTERTQGVDVAVMPEDVHAGICQESREKEDRDCQHYHEARVPLHEILVLIVSRYLKLTRLE